MYNNVRAIGVGFVCVCVCNTRRLCKYLQETPRVVLRLFSPFEWFNDGELARKGEWARNRWVISSPTWRRLFCTDIYNFIYYNTTTRSTRKVILFYRTLRFSSRLSFYPPPLLYLLRFSVFFSAFCSENTILFPSHLLRYIPTNLYCCEKHVAELCKQ